MAVHRQVLVVDAVEVAVVAEAWTLSMRMHEVGPEVGPCSPALVTVVAVVVREALYRWSRYRKPRHTRDTRPHPRISGPCRPDIRTQVLR